jgi:prophage regulatory protein
MPLKKNAKSKASKIGRQIRRSTGQVLSFPTELPTHGYSREPQVLHFFPFSHSTLWRRVKDKKFPSPTRLSEGVTAWDNEKLWKVIEAGGKWTEGQEAKAAA